MKYIVALFIFLMALLSTNAFAYSNDVDHYYTCKIAVIKTVDLPHSLKRVDIKAGCNSPHGFRVYIVNPFNNMSVTQDIAQSDVAGYKLFTTYLTQYKFPITTFKVEPTL